MEKLNYELQDGEGLSGTCGKRTRTETTPGIAPEAVQDLRNDLESATVKNTEQQKAVEAEQNSTAAQNDVMAKCADLIGSIHHAVISEYGKDDKVMMKKFHIGPNIPISVSGMKSELKYLNSTVPEYTAVLKKHGITDTDITNLDSFYTELTEADKLQENAKDAQKVATKARNQSMKKLIRTKESIRHDAKIIFKKQPLVLIEFEKMPPPPPGRKPGQPGDDKTPPAK